MKQLIPTRHTHGAVCDFPADDDMECQLHWAEHHANDLTIAEHNRRYFAAEVERIRAAQAAQGGEHASN